MAQAITCLWQWDANMDPKGPAMQAAGTATDMYFQASGSAPPITNWRQKTPGRKKNYLMIVLALVSSLYDKTERNPYEARPDERNLIKTRKPSQLQLLNLLFKLLD